MQLRWRIILPALGLVFFALITYDSVQRHHPGRFFCWSGIRLDSSPGKPREKTCADNTEDCLEFDTIVDSGLLAKVLFVLAMPAFFVGSGVVTGLGRIGISEVLTFLLVVPLLIGTWLYVLGWLIDRKWRSRSAAT